MPSSDEKRVFPWKRKADSNAPGEKDSSAAKKSRATTLLNNASESITNVVSLLHNLLQTKEADLKQREAEFERRVKTFESFHPSIGGDNDVIQLNVGGRTNIAVLRNTLTQFPDSMLAAKFSGRWDDALEKDRDGNYFVDADPDNFGILLKFLRVRMTNHGHVPADHVPFATFEFCSMLEYYNLMSGVYLQNWEGKDDTFTSEEVRYGTVSLTSKDSVTAGVVLQPKLKLLEFTVEFDKGTTGSVGWISSGYNPTNISELNCSNSSGNCLFLNMAERKALGPRISNYGTRPTYDDNILAENLRINHTESTTKVVCRRFGGGKSKVKFSIGLEDGTTVEAFLEDYVKPMIVFTGKVTVSDLKYAIEELPGDE